MRLLIVSVHYPPIAGNSPRVMGELTRVLIEGGHQVDVVTIDPLEDHPVYKVDPEAMRHLPREAVVHRVPMGPINRMGARIECGRPAGGHVEAVGTGFSRAVRSAGRRIYKAERFWKPFAIPDAIIDWMPAAYLAARRLAKDNSPDLIVSFGYPYTNHIIAYLLARRGKTEWVPIYGDAWANHPSLLRNQPRWNVKVQGILERTVLRRATRIIAGSTAMVPYFESQHGVGREKIRVVRFAFVDRRSYQRTDAAPSPTFRIVYTGNIYGELQDTLPFLKALRRYAERGVEVVFLGRLDKKTTQRIAALGLKNAKFMGWCERAEVISAQKSASVLLLFGQGSGPPFPDKIYEYFAANRPILCVPADATDTAGKMVLKHRRGLVPANSEAALADAIGRLLELDRCGKLESVFDLRDLPEYTLARSAQSLADAVLGQPE